MNEFEKLLMEELYKFPFTSRKEGKGIKEIEEYINTLLGVKEKDSKKEECSSKEDGKSNLHDHIRKVDLPISEEKPQCSYPSYENTTNTECIKFAEGTMVTGNCIRIMNTFNNELVNNSFTDFTIAEKNTIGVTPSQIVTALYLYFYSNGEDEEVDLCKKILSKLNK